MPFHEGALKAAKAHNFHEALSPPQARHRPGMYSSSSSSSSSSAFYSSSGFFFSRRCCVCRDEGSCLQELRPKRRRFGLFYFLKTPPKMTSFGTKSLIQMTSFWISDLKQFQKNVVLDSSSPKRCRFRMWRELKKILLPSKMTSFCIRKVQNNVVLAVKH